MSKKAPKVVHFIRSVNPALGGPIQGIKSLHEFTAGKLDRTIVSLDSPADPWVKEFPLPIHAVGPGTGLYGFSFGALKRVEKLLPEVDSVIINGLWQYNSILGRQFAKLRNVPLFTFTHGMLDPWFKERYPLKHIKKCLYWPFADYRVLRDSTAVLFTTQLECELARNSFPWLYKANEVVLGYGCPPPPEFKTSQRDAFYSACPGAVNKKVILFLSRIHEKKGCDLAVNAFKNVFGGNDEYRLVMAGPSYGNMTQELKALSENLGVANQILWPGMLSGESKCGAFYTAEAFTLPSHQENFGIAVAEALSFGLPVLTTDKVNIYREIESYQAGLISSDTVQGTTEIYSRFSSLDLDGLRELKFNALRCYSECFNAEQAARRLVNLIEMNIFS